MKLKLILPLFLGIIVSFSVKAQDVTVHGASFPIKMKINDKIVKYNGAGVRTKYFIKLYVSALYVPNTTTDAQEIIDQDVESAVRLKLLSGLVTRDKFVETVRDGFETSTEGKATQQEIDNFMELFTEEFSKGDDIILIYKPESGVEIFMNGKHLGGEKGLEFKKALWGIWLGKKPVNDKLKNSMLGKV